MKNKVILFPLFICVLIWNVVILMCNGKDKDIDKDTKKIYGALQSEIARMNGKVIGRRGRITNLFAIDIDFNESKNYDVNHLFIKISELGFKLKSNSHIDKSYIFCREKSGFLVNGGEVLTIDYRYVMPYCLSDDLYRLK